MEKPEKFESFLKFKDFLNTWFVRRQKEGCNADDFKKEEFECIQLHLEDFLPLMTIEEINRVNIYFHSAFIVHLKNGLKILNVFPQRLMTPEPVNVQKDEIVNFNVKPTTESEPTSQLRTVDEKELALGPQAESNNLITTENIGPLFQSTPLSVPLLPEQPGVSYMRQQERRVVKDTFIPDIISHINISPIHREYSAQRKFDIQPKTISTLSVETDEVSFIRNFAHIEREIFSTKNTSSTQRINRGTRKRLNVEHIVVNPKKRMDKIKFDNLCAYSNKSRTNKQENQSIEYFSYFALIRTKLSNEIRRNNALATGSEREHFLPQKVKNLSNILRAYSTQNQTSINPVQISQIRITRSPITPQGLLSASFLFTPLRGDELSFEPRKVTDHGTSFPSTGSLQRQQPLLTIPERESSVHIPLIPQDEVQEINTPFSDIPREDHNVEMLEGPSMQIAYNDPSVVAQQQKNIFVNNSVENITPLIERESVLPVRIVQDRSSNLPSEVLEDFEISAPLPPLEEQCHAINRNDEVILTDAPISLPGHSEQQQHINSVPLQKHDSQDATLLVNTQSDNLHINWFEILRPRNDLIEYPREVVPIRRKRRKRRRRNSPEQDEQQVGSYELPVIPYEENSIVNVGDSGPQPHFYPSPEIQYQTLFSDLPEKQTEEHEISHLVTQYPLQIETQVKEYLELIKRASRKLEYINWERFDSYLFNENDHFRLYTYILKQIIKSNYVTMNKIYEEEISRLEAAKGFKFILDLKTMGLIHIDSVDSQIIGIKLMSD